MTKIEKLDFNGKLIKSFEPSTYLNGSFYSFSLADFLNIICYSDSYSSMKNRKFASNQNKYVDLQNKNMPIITFSGCLSNKEKLTRKAYMQLGDSVTSRTLTGGKIISYEEIDKIIYCPQNSTFFKKC